MAKNKTTETTASVKDYLQAIPDANRRKDCSDLVSVMEKATGYVAKMWGPSIVGFGSYHYKYDSCHEGDAPLAAFSSRSNAIVLYLGSAEPGYAELLEKFGKFKQGKSCIYIKKLADIDLSVLVQLIHSTMLSTTKKYPSS